MGQIYRQCLRNIAATKSSDSEGGIFFDRDPQLVKPLKLAVKFRETYKGVDHQGNYYVWLSDVSDDHVEASPLNKRGWVLQGRLLSPKVLHFSDQIFWECKTENFCEIMPTANLDISRHR